MLWVFREGSKSVSSDRGEGDEEEWEAEKGEWEEE